MKIQTIRLYWRKKKKKKERIASHARNVMCILKLSVIFTFILVKGKKAAAQQAFCDFLTDISSFIVYSLYISSIEQNLCNCSLCYYNFLLVWMFTMKGVPWSLERFLILSENLLAFTIKRNIYEEILKDSEGIFRVKKKRLKEDNLQLCLKVVRVKMYFYLSTTEDATRKSVNWSKRGTFVYLFALWIYQQAGCHCCFLYVAILSCCSSHSQEGVFFCSSATARLLILSHACPETFFIS